MIDDRRQVELLSRTFFSRLFESELMPAGLPQVQLVVGVIAFLAAPSFAVPILMAKKYIRLGPELARAAMAQDRALTLLLSMIATAMVTLVIWENVFPDRRDCRHMGVLPIRMRNFVVARMTALLALFGLIFAGTTVLSSIAFAFTGALFGAPGGFAGVGIAHFVALVGAEGFVFFGIIALQCALLNLAGPSTAQRVALALQMLVVVSVLQMPNLLPPRDAYTMVGGEAAWTSMAQSLWLPPMWFLGLFECLTAGRCSEAAPLVSRALISATLLPLAALAFYAASYKRLTRLAIEGRPLPRSESRRFISRTVSALARAVTWSQPAAAVCAFTVRTLVRSRQHRMLLAGSIGIALAIILSSLLPVPSQLGRAVGRRLNVPVLAAPLVLMALSLAGARMLFAIPTEIKSNWTFRLREPLALRQAMSGATAALILIAVMPAVTLAWMSTSLLWGWTIGIRHSLFCLLMGLTAAQLLMRGIDKVPFTCTYFPGKARFTRLWPVYLTLLSTFTYTAASFASVALLHPRAHTITLAVLLTAFCATAWARSREASRVAQLRFEEEPVDSLTLLAGL